MYKMYLALNNLQIEKSINAECIFVSKFIDHKNKS